MGARAEHHRVSATPGPVLLVTKGLDLGGIERIVVDLATGMHRRGVDVEVAVVNHRRDQLAEPLEHAGIKLHRLGGSDRIGIGAALRLAKLIRSGRYNVIHVHGPLPAVVVRCVPSGSRIVTTSHTLWTGLRPSTRLLWRATAHRDTAVLAVSSAVAESLPTRIARRARVIPHGVDLTAIEAARSSTGQRAGGRDVTAICVASHRDVKNYPNLLHAVALARVKVPTLRLLAVGDGPERERHRELAESLGLSEVVQFHPATLTVLELMAQSDLLVVASDFEGQPLVVMEALALGLPVVATAVGRVPELVNPMVGRMVRPGDTEALADAISEVAGDSELRQALGSQAARAAAGWSLDHAVASNLAAYGSRNDR